MRSATACLAGAPTSSSTIERVFDLAEALSKKTGQLPLTLARAAAQISSEVQLRAMAIDTTSEPLLIVSMGVAVMLIVLALLLPIIQLNIWVR